VTTKNRIRQTRTQRRMLLDPVVTDQTVLELARQRMRTVFDRFDHVAVMFSGGKDSTCALHLAMEERERRGIEAPLDVIFYDEEAIPYETEEYVRRVSEWPEIELRWLCLPTRQNNACSPRHPYWYPWAPEDEKLWCRPLPPEGIVAKDFKAWNFVDEHDRIAIPEANAILFDSKKHGTVGMCMGIRADESMTRRRAVLRRKEDNWIVPFVRDTYHACRFPGCTNESSAPTSKTCDEHRGMRLPSGDVTDIRNVFKCYPIYDWRTEDVWTYARDYARDYNHAYDKLEMAGLPHFRQRCAPPYAAEPMGSLWTFKTCFPELWDKMVERVPGAATAARYARSELFSFGHRPTVQSADWWDERAWQNLILSLLERHSEKTAQITAKRVELFIQRHYAKTNGDPILPDVAHPVTGVSWQWLAMLSERGDPKQRKNPEWQIAQRDDPEKVKAARKKYTDGLKLWKLNQREVDAK
jgi:predicted phosphoadenosine phosphosulfate sulfurtransferase